MKLINAKQVAEILEVTKNNVYLYVYKGLLTKYKSENPLKKEFLFNEEEVLKLKDNKTGFTPREISNKYNIPYHQIIKKIHDKEINVTEYTRGNRICYLVSDEEIAKLITKIEPVPLQMSTNDNSYYLFTAYRSKTSGNVGRIVEIYENNFIFNFGGMVLSRKRFEELDFEPVYSLEVYRRITKAGYVTLRSNKCTEMYQLIDLLYQQVGVQNFKIVIYDEYIKLQIRSSKLDISSLEFPTEFYYWLADYKLEGDIISLDKRTVQFSSLEQISTFTLGKKDKLKLERLAQEQNLSISKFVQDIVIDYLNREGDC